MNELTTLWLTTGIFTVTYLALAIGKVPGLRMDRPGIAFVGAAIMLCSGVITLGQAIAPDSIDYDTLFLLLSMMIVVGCLRLSGFFVRLTHWWLDRIGSPKSLLAMVILLSGLLSAFLVNDIVCLALTPIVLSLTKHKGYRSVPHVIGLATAANIGSTGTITGNPQNIFIGAHSHIPYGVFALHLMPMALLGLIVDFIVIAWVYRAELADNVVDSHATQPGPYEHIGTREDATLSGRHGLSGLELKCVIVSLLMIGLFFTGLPITLVALGAAAILMIGRISPDRIYEELDWTLLLLFTGLFIVVHAFQLHVVSRWGIDGWHLLLAHPVDLLSIASAGLSNLVSNVPAVLLFEPVMRAMPSESQQVAWLALAMSSTLAGNLTIVGSVANLIVVESARREGINVSFWEYCKAGIPVTVLTLAIGILWLKYVSF